MASAFSSQKYAVANLCRLLLVSATAIYVIFIISLPNQFITISDFYPSELFSILIKQTASIDMLSNPPTNLNHIVFGIMGSEKAYHFRKHYIESWWRPNVTRGFLYLDKAPSEDLLPWSALSPPYKVSDNLKKVLGKTEVKAPRIIRLVHGIKELLRDADDGNVRWVVTGDDDTIFFLENVVDVLRQYDHTRHHYIGATSEFVMANYWYSFNQAFGGGGVVMSYSVAKAISDNMESCMTRYAPNQTSSDTIIMFCIADFGVDLSPHTGFHQMDLRGDISGFLSSQPRSPLISLHHLDMVKPIFPKMERKEAVRHLMKAAAADESRTLQQTVCHEKKRGWTISISWGYSGHIYEEILPRSHLLPPIETFRPWVDNPTQRAKYMFKTRLPSRDPCEAPHVFFLNRVRNSSDGILTTYSRAAPRMMEHCPSCGDRCPDFVMEIRVISPTTKRIGKDRCECCDIVGVNGSILEAKFRECRSNEFIA